LPVSIPQGLSNFMSLYEATWNANDYAALKNLWDPSVDEPWWYPEECETPLVGWEAVEGYWRLCETIIARIGLRTWDLRWKPLPGDLALVGFQMKWTAILRGDPAPIGGEVKVSVVLNRAADPWLCLHYMEAALGPLPYMRRAYQLAAEPALIGAK
jgi:hypothetical protein